MTERHCPTCAGAIDTGTICIDCAAALQRDLAAIGDAITELHTQLAKQARTNTASPLPSPPDPEPDWHHPDMLAIASHPLPYHPGASDVLELLRLLLIGWTRDITPDPGQQPGTMRGMARHLRRHDWRNHPAADEFADELAWTLERIAACIDATAGWRYLGPCGATIGEAEEGGYLCPGDVYLIGNRPPKCRDCGATHATDQRLEWIANLAADQLVTATIAAGALSAWGAHIKPDLIRLWAHRGRLLVRGHDSAGRALYAFAECRTLALESVERKAGRRGERMQA